MITLHHGDCLTIMPTLPDGCADMILADLPYGNGITPFAWDSPIPFEPLWEQYKRLIKPRGAVVLFGKQPFTSMVVMSNLEWFKYCWVWEKTMATNYLNSGNRPLTAHEDIAVFSSGTVANASPNLMPYIPQKWHGASYFRRGLKQTDNTKWRANGAKPGEMVITKSDDGARHPRSIITFANPNLGALHPTQKPVALLAYLIRTYTNKGETVLDNCAGSGSTGEAAFEEGRNAILIERDPEYFEVMRRRLEEVQTRPRTMRMELA